MIWLGGTVGPWLCPGPGLGAGTRPGTAGTAGSTPAPTGSMWSGPPCSPPWMLPCSGCLGGLARIPSPTVKGSRSAGEMGRLNRLGPGPWGLWGDRGWYAGLAGWCTGSGGW